MSKKCPICGRGIGVYQDYVGGTSFFRCDICGHTGCDFEDVTLFDTITASPEVLAEKLVYYLRYGNCYASSIISDVFKSKEEANAATVARLKEVEK